MRKLKSTIETIEEIEPKKRTNNRKQLFVEVNNEIQDFVIQGTSAYSLGNLRNGLIELKKNIKGKEVLTKHLTAKCIIDVLKEEGEIKDNFEIFEYLSELLSDDIWHKVETKFNNEILAIKAIKNEKYCYAENVIEAKKILLRNI